MAIKLTNVSIGDDGTLWVVDSKMRLWGRVARGTEWTLAENASAQQVSVARGDQIWALSEQGDLYKRDGDTWALNRLRNPAMPTARPMPIPMGTAIRIDDRVTMALSHCPNTAR